MNKNKHTIAILWPHPLQHNHSSVSTMDNLLSMFPTKRWASRLEIHYGVNHLLKLLLKWTGRFKCGRITSSTVCEGVGWNKQARLSPWWVRSSLKKLVWRVSESSASTARSLKKICECFSSWKIFNINDYYVNNFQCKNAGHWEGLTRMRYFENFEIKAVECELG